MEMHSRQSLYDIHGIGAPPRRRSRWRSIACLGVARILAVLKGIKKAIVAELAARDAITELASMDDRMLRDLGITRSEIKSVVRWSRGNVGVGDGPVLSNYTGQHDPALPTISSPDLSSEGLLEQQLQRLRLGDQSEPERLVSLEADSRNLLDRP